VLFNLISGFPDIQISVDFFAYWPCILQAYYTYLLVSRFFSSSCFVDSLGFHIQAAILPVNKGRFTSSFLILMSVSLLA
jgi:hypothetical protein